MKSWKSRIIEFNRIYEFLEKYKLIYPLQFCFQQHSTCYALLNLTESIMKALDEANFACGIFVDLEKAFDTVAQNILLKKTRSLWSKRNIK